MSLEEQLRAKVKAGQHTMRLPAAVDALSALRSYISGGEPPARGLMAFLDDYLITLERIALHPVVVPAQPLPRQYSPGGLPRVRRLNIQCRAPLDAVSPAGGKGKVSL